MTFLEIRWDYNLYNRLLTTTPLYNIIFRRVILFTGQVAELADAQALGVCGRQAVRVQIPPCPQLFMGV